MKKIQDKNKSRVKIVVQDTSFNDRALPAADDIEASLKLKSINLSNLDSTRQIQKNDELKNKESPKIK